MARATISSAYRSEGVRVRLKSDQFNERNIVISINGKERVHILVEEDDQHVRVIMQQVGIGMIDGQSSLQLLESSKTTDDSDVYGGYYDTLLSVESFSQIYQMLRYRP